ncbi:A-kinase anchor protein 9-like isoform X1 [Sinocyclocheilus grahami]|uniref:A-kinase anchor protein 9-like isoform X1 n=1 Tax=Sinocyclocheilus grahami TaxID=75366 RepID=UPI0007AD232D|nr:PREDICTED: A-kinase anchor protein 9-like isoform X1 [Sinocyclocheilus grahami]
MKQRMDELKSAHSSLQSRYERLQGELEEALREKTAAFVVLQAQVQALEESAGSQVMSLSRRVEEKDSELRACRLKLELAQMNADAEVAQLEEELREKVAAVLVSQAQLEAVQTQTKELRAGEAMGPSAQLHSEGLTAQAATAGKTSLMTEKLKELEEGLSGMQKDQELQKQLLSSSEEEVMEYERRLAVMIDLLNQMRTKPTHHRPLPPAEMKESTVTQLQTALSQVENETETAELLQELQEVKGQVSSTQQELESCRDQSVRLQELLQEREMSIALLKDQLHRASQEGDEPTAELQEVKGEAAATKEELRSSRERSLKLQEEIEVRDACIAELKDKVQALQTALAKSSEEPLQQEKKKRGSREHHGMDKSRSSSSCVDVCVQTHPSGAQELQQVMLGYEEKIAQMQELHAAEILDMEARHISESESLRRDSQQLEDECRALRDQLRTAQAPSVRSEHSAVSPLKDGYASDSSSDWSQRVGFDLPHLQQESRSTPEGAHRDVDPDVLPDRVKSLLREVHQEGMQVLSLSELPLSEADRPPPQSWSKERDALINTVESLKLLISTLQSGTDTQGDGDWRAELLSAVQHVFVQERDVLKNVLYSHLERLDTADAVIHLSQLERALAEQDARHRELMGALCTADRSSLRSEIQQLRAQLTQRHHQDAAGMKSESGAELMPGGAAVGCGSDRLNQTKLELESALKSQHKHLKELDALRAEVSLKAAEVDALNDRLALEQKRARELQWAFEKEKRKSDRKEETEREEVEELKLALEEQAREASVSAELQVRVI